MAEAGDINVDELRRRARRRLIGAVVLALAAAVVVPMLLESDPKPLGEDVSVKIPPEDGAKFVNRLSDKAAKAPAAEPAAKSPATKEAANAPAKPNSAPAPDVATSASTSVAPPVSASVATSVSPSGAGSAATSAPSAAVDPSAAPAANLPGNLPPPKKSIAQAEQKMLGATGKPAASPAPASPPVAVPAATTSAAVSPATAEPAVAPREGFSVQLAAFADDKGANSLANKLKRAAYPAYTEPLTTSKGTLWRVRVGPYSSRDEAVGVRDKLKGEGYSGIVAAAK